MFYEADEHPLFWAALEELDQLADPDRLAMAVNVLVTWAVSAPDRALASEQGIRVLKLPSTDINGGMTPPLRLAYFLDETPRPSGAAGAVTLLHIETYDEADETEQGSFSPSYSAEAVQPAAGTTVAISRDNLARQPVTDELLDASPTSSSSKQFRVYPGGSSQASMQRYRAFTIALSEIDVGLSALLEAAREYRNVLRRHEEWARRLMRPDTEVYRDESIR